MSQSIDAQNTDAGGGGSIDQGNKNEGIQNQATASVPCQDQRHGKPCNSHCRSNKNTFDIVTKVIEILVGIFVGGALICVGYLQYSVYSRQAGIMETQTEISVAINRAFVNFDSFDFASVDTGPSGPGKVIGIWFNAVNNGNVSTKNFKSLVSCVSVPAVKTEPFELFKWNESDAIPDALGPKQKRNVGSPECQLVTHDMIRDIQFGKSFMYLLGEVQYRDRIDPKSLHKTRISQQLYVSAVSTDEKGVMHFLRSMESRGRNNCTDEDCPD
jgi:hypothetical protein